MTCRTSWGGPGQPRSCFGRQQGDFYEDSFSSQRIVPGCLPHRTSPLNRSREDNQGVLIEMPYLSGPVVPGCPTWSVEDRLPHSVVRGQLGSFCRDPLSL